MKLIGCLVQGACVTQWGFPSLAEESIVFNSRVPLSAEQHRIPKSSKDFQNSFALILQIVSTRKVTCSHDTFTYRTFIQEERVSFQMSAMKEQEGVEYTNTKTVEQSYENNLAVHQPGMSYEDMVDGYSKWAETGGYDEDLKKGVYNGPTYAAETVKKMIPCKTARIIDVAAGTGKVAEHLKLHGYENLDALDGSSGMLKVARDNRLYKNYILARFEATGTPILDDTYDGLVISGGMGEGHIPAEALHEMARIVKTGGMIIIVMREEYLTYVEGYKDGELERIMDRLEENQKWKKVSRNVVSNYSFNKNGVVFTFRVL
ncbi:unnamed protein product [Owenia fusiformis]|uniref:Uncharacterized protein n=1 Tax=Owenia fusiformis TaxID=6347 RepID=A0A8J1XTA5_OWEFU|nr:unnamed protein product [Owenia fusiformis]